ncbi:hypothetical protein [Euzebya rosea]|uniref:hypothetical protein n=1 Tax=Euzebya rosea TaxID=2052804 RepID=UPI000D3ECCB2|nr:hypothetical protein [Euzebya rosea]
MSNNPWQGPPGQPGQGGPQGWQQPPGQGGQPGWGGQPGPQGQPAPPSQPGPPAQPGWGGQPGYQGQPGYGSQPGYGGQPGPAGFQGPPGLGGGGGWQPPKKPLIQRPAFFVPLALVLIVGVGVIVFLLARDGGDGEVALGEGTDATQDEGQDGGQDETDDLVDAMSSVEPTEAANAGSMAESMTDALATPDPEAAQTEAVRPEPLGAMPEAPPEPAPFEPAATPLPQPMQDAGMSDGDLSDLRAIALPVAPFQEATLDVGVDQVAVVVFDLQVGDTVSVSAVGGQDPDLFVFGPDDALVIEDTMMGPGSNALANVISAPVAGQYLAAALNATGAPGQISMTLQTFAEFELLDVPSGTVAPQDITTFELEAFAGERIHVLVASSTFVPTIGIGQNGDILAFGSIVADNVQLVELDVPADGFFDVVVFGNDTGGSFVMYTTVQVGG